jgi:hypothetical protein
MRKAKDSQLSSLISDAIRELDAYTGTPSTRKHYNAFREAKRAIYALVGDDQQAKGLLRFVNLQTHWNERIQDRRERAAEEAATERLYLEQEERRQRQRKAQAEFLRYEVTRATVNRWLRNGIPEKSWPSVIEALAPDAATLKRWERSGIPEERLREVEKGSAQQLSAIAESTGEYLEEPPGYDLEEPEEYDPSEEHDLEYWEDIASEYAEEYTDYSQFEKLS